MNHPSNCVPLSLLTLLLTPLTALGQDKLDLRVNLAKDATAWFQSHAKMHQAIDMGGQQMEVTSDTFQGFGIKVLTADKDAFEVEITYLRSHGSMSLPMMGDVEFDSSGAVDKSDDTGSAIAMGMTALVGKAFKATVSKTGEVKEIKGVEEALADARKKAGPMGSQMLGGILNEGAIKRQVQSLFGSLPAEPTSVGGNWTRETNSAMRLAPIVTNSKFTLAKVDAETMESTFTGSIASAPKAKDDAKGKDEKGKDADEDDEQAAMAKKMMANLKIGKGAVSGKEVVGRKDGLVRRSELVQDTEMTMPSPMGEGDMSIVQKVTTIVERSTEDVVNPKKADEGKDKEGDKGKEVEKGKGGK